MVVYTRSETYKPQITLNGTMTLTKKGETLPTVTLKDIGVAAEETTVVLKGTHNFRFEMFRKS